MTSISPRALVASFAIAVLPACSDPITPSFTGSVDLTQPWTTATPESVGADALQIASALDGAAANTRLLSILAVKDGRIVVEEYFRGNHADSLNDVRSITKSVISAVTGIALELGFLAGLNEPIRTYLHPNVAVLDSAVQQITIGDLLTMTGGFEWNELGGPSYGEWILSADHIEHVVNKPLVSTPGSTFLYNSGAVHLLGVAVQEAVGMPLPDFADQYLFHPIGIRERVWENLTRGYVNGGAGIDLKPRDLARFGQLFLQEGQSGETQVLPARWTAEVAEPRFPWRVDFGPVRDYTYGYLWWIVTGDLEPAYYAWGFGGQFVYVVPDLNLVLVATTEWRGITAEGGPAPFEIAALELIISDLLPAFRN